MSLSTTGTLRFLLDIFERQSLDLGMAQARHTLDTGDIPIATGIGDYQANLVWSDRRTAAGAADLLDLRGALVGVFQPANEVKVLAIFIRSLAKTPGQVLAVGGAGANPAFAGLFADATDKIKIGPGGVFAWYSPIDLFLTTNATADILSIDPGAATIDYEIVILGRTA